jgi:hypothetical protein
MTAVIVAKLSVASEFSIPGIKAEIGLRQPCCMPTTASLLIFLPLSISINPLKPTVSIRTIRLNSYNFYVLTTQCASVYFTAYRTNSDYFPYLFL